MTITIRGIECENAGEALQYADADAHGGRPITLAGRYFVVTQDEANRLEADGVSFAFLSDHALPDGTYRLMTVPVN